MPEVAEVHRVKDHLRVAVRGRRINQVVLHSGAKVSGLIPTEVIMVEVAVYGKKILFHLSNGQVLIGSLGMTGSFRYRPGNNTRVSLHLSEILEQFDPQLSSCPMTLYFVDDRMLGDLKLVSSWPMELKTQGYGPDILAAALSEWISWDGWWKIFSKAGRRQLSAVLLDQHVIAGIGNYLKSEICYFAQVHPLERASRIGMDGYRRIWAAAHRVVLVAYQHGGLTMKDFISPNGEPGIYTPAAYGRTVDFFDRPLIYVHDREGRSTYFLQEMPLPRGVRLVIDSKNKLEPVYDPEYNEK